MSRNRTNILAILSTISVVYLMFPPSASAYIDPGSGSIMLQGVISAIAMAIAALVGFRAKLAALWKRVRSGKE